VPAALGAQDIVCDKGDTEVSRLDFTGNHAFASAVLANGIVTTLAGSAAGVVGSADGVGADARFGTLSQIALDPAGNLYVADTTNNLIRKVTPAGVVSTVIGVVSERNNNLTSTPLHINFPFGVAAVGTGQLLLTAHPVVLRASVP